MEPNETEVMADQGNWTVQDCILVRVASQVGSFTVVLSRSRFNFGDTWSFPSSLIMTQKRSIKF